MSKELPRQSRSFMWLDDLRRDVIYGVRTLLTVALGLALVAMTACYLPARRVLRIEPAQSLRE